MKRALLGLGLIGLSAAILVDRVNAQAVVSDGTLNTIVTQSGNTFTIDNGTISGSNLFHSFREFSIPTGGSAIFNNAANIQNIFSRVTGGTPSNIDGAIRANGTANLFLLNPSGILFGSSASLNIGGSFVGTTAQSIQFADGMEFSAVNSTTPPLLTMSVPTGLQMGQNPGDITVQGTGHQLVGGLFTPIIRSSTQTSTLQVGSGNTIALIGQNVRLVDAVLTAENGRIEIGGVKAGIVGLNQITSDLQLDYQNVTSFGDIRLLEQSLVDTSGLTSHGIRLQGQNVSFTDGSTALIQTVGEQTPSRLQVNAAGSLHLSGETRNAPETGVVTGVISSRLMTETLGTGRGASIEVTAGDLRLTDGGIILARTYGLGTSGEININVAGDAQIYRTSTLNPTIASGIASTTFSTAQSGSINITAANITMTDGALINSINLGQGKGGNVNVTASGTIALKGVETRTFSPTNIGASVFREGRGGDLNLTASRLIVEDGSAVSTATLSHGDGGNIMIYASDSVEVRGSAFGGTFPSRISTAAEVFPLEFRQRVGLPDRPTGDAGNLKINSFNIRVDNSGQIAVRNEGSGNGGLLSLNADSVRLDRQGQLIANTDSGEGGNINLNVRSDLLLRNSSLISTAAKGSGNGGNMVLNAPIILGLENSDIIANAEDGRGGNINIVTQGIIGLEFRNTRTPRTDPTNDITASSEVGLNGTVRINNIGVDPNSGLIQLSESLIDPSQKIAKECAENQGSSFIISGRGGMPQNPMNEAKNGRPWADLRDPSAYRTPRPVTAQLPTPPEPIVQATDWRRNPQTGKVELIAAQPIPSDASVTCAIAP